MLVVAAPSRVPKAATRLWSSSGRTKVTLTTSVAWTFTLTSLWNRTVAGVVMFPNSSTVLTLTTASSLSSLSLALSGTPPDSKSPSTTNPRPVACLRCCFMLATAIGVGKYTSMSAASSHPGNAVEVVTRSKISRAGNCIVETLSLVIPSIDSSEVSLLPWGTSVPPTTVSTVRRNSSVSLRASSSRSISSRIVTRTRLRVD
mmetsp:Transcript_23786/g.53988  ORF Transcript_23786/g.53988 Transcript_23786/m.53988 type:complete len:202 (-) Transcript_23786:331-936(-)